MQEKKHIHFIGICGVAMSALAIALDKKGYKVTGSDQGFHPPISTHLKNTGIKFYPGWHVDKMSKDGDPDLVVVGNVAGSTNPEWLYTQEKNIPYKSYPELIAEYIIKKNSIVCTGTYGKTSSTALLAWVFTQCKKKPNYMFGGLVRDNFPAAAIADSEYSIVEGDEYKSARWDMQPKFAHYSPTQLLLTAIEWDHADVYPTEEDYFDAFRKLINEMPESGLIIVSEKTKQIVQLSNCPIVTYGKSNDVDYKYSDVKLDKDGLGFNINNKSEIYNLKSKVLGDYMAENITGCFAIALENNLNPDEVVKAIASFPGIKRRLEKRYEGKITVIDDIAHSPTKAFHTLQTLRNIYDKKIIAVFEPNTGNRHPKSAPAYDKAFQYADEIIIPRLTKIKVDPNDPDQPFDGQTLTEVIAKTHTNARFIEDDDELVKYILENTTEDDVVVFLGSHGFRGMIEELIKNSQ